MTSTSLVRTWTRSVKLALQAKTPADFAAEVLGDTLVPEAAPQEFPKLPKELNLTPEFRKAMRSLPGLFGDVQPQQRRALDEAEIKAIGDEFEAIQTVLKLIGQRDKDIREIVRTHQDVKAEQEGRAFPKDIRRNGNLVAKATERSSDGHYLLAAPQNPERTELPGSTKAFSNQYTSGKTTVDLEQLSRDYEAGELDRETYLAITSVKRVVDPEKLKKHVLRTGLVGLMARVTKVGRPSSSMNFRGLTKQ